MKKVIDKSEKYWRSYDIDTEIQKRQKKKKRIQIHFVWLSFIEKKGDKEMKGFERVSRNLGMDAIEHKDMGCVEFRRNGKSLWYDLQIVVNAFTSKNISEVAALLAQLIVGRYRSKNAPSTSRGHSSATR